MSQLQSVRISDLVLSSKIKAAAQIYGIRETAKYCKLNKVNIDVVFKALFNKYSKQGKQGK